MTEFGFQKVQNKKFDLGLMRHVDELLPYKVVRDTFKGTLEWDDRVLTGYTVPAGKQLKILFLRVWSEYTGSTVVVITQVGVSAGIGNAPAGIIDYPMLESAGAEVIGPVPLDSPIHVIEGSFYIHVQDPDSAPAGDNQISVTWWGVEDTAPETSTGLV